MVEFSNAVADVLLLLYKGIVIEILLHYMVEFHRDVVIGPSKDIF